jgi:hypothetical protein
MRRGLSIAELIRQDGLDLDPEPPRLPCPIPPRLLIVACSATKATGEGLVARDRYQGPLWQTLRKDDITSDEAGRDPRNANAEILGGRTRQGWFVWASDVPASTVPADLASVMRLARQQGCEHVAFDCDALPMEDLPILHPDFPGAPEPG